ATVTPTAATAAAATATAAVWWLVPNRRSAWAAGWHSEGCEVRRTSAVTRFGQDRRRHGVVRGHAGSPGSVQADPRQGRDAATAAVAAVRKEPVRFRQRAPLAAVDIGHGHPRGGEPAAREGRQVV